MVDYVAAGRFRSSITVVVVVLGAIIIASIDKARLLARIIELRRQEMPTERPKILLLGDSLTQTSWDGWGGGLAHRYQRRADVLNRGTSGYNTRWYMKYAETSGVWEETSSPSSVKLVMIFFGANDASLAQENPRHYVPLEEYAQNLKALLDLSQKSYPAAKVLFITPPPVHHGQRLEFQVQRYKEKATGVLERTLENAGKYADACMTVAKENSIPCLDLYNIMKGEKGNDFGKYFYDGLHFNKVGHDFVLKHLLEALEKNFPSISVTPDPITGQENNSGSKCEGMPSSGPYHDQIDHTSCEKAFVAEDEPSAKRAETEE
jgi:lysophospholipase L1-like esterase